ncbi:MAG: transglycosylase SLT domain-containing protein [candidate division Zixibacteria bacterium]|nr:transglycosylase SLT domain-containing protein [candidate division Zixibacteria bacterium]
MQIDGAHRLTLIISSILIICLFLIKPGYSDEAELSTDILKNPRELIASKTFDSAIVVIDTLRNKYFLKSIDIDLPGNGIIKYRLADLLHIQEGYSYIKSGKPQYALINFKMVNNDDYLLSELKHVLLAEAYKDFGKFKEACEWADWYINENSDGIFTAVMLAMKAEHERNEENYRQAADLFNQAAASVNRKETASEYFIKTAEAFKLAGYFENYNNAYYNAALNSDWYFLRDSLSKKLPKDDIIHIRKFAYVLAKRKLHRTALEYLKNTPNDDSLIFLEGLCRQRIGHYRKARLLFQSINKDTPYGEELYIPALFRSALSAYQRKHYKTAIKELRRLKETYPQNPFAELAEGFVELITINKNKTTQEIQEYIFNSRSADRSYGFEETKLINKAWHSFENKNYSEACSLFIELQKSENKKEEWAEAYFWAWRSAKKAGDEELSETLKKSLLESTEDIYYPTVAGLTTAAGLLKSGGKPSDNNKISVAEKRFIERWAEYKNGIGESADDDKADIFHLIIGMYSLSKILGLEDISRLVFARIEGNGFDYNKDYVEMLNFMLENRYYDDFYRLAHLHKDTLKVSPSSRFLLYPPIYGDEIASASVKAGIDPFLIWAVMKNESLFDEDVVSYAGAIGLMQLMPKTAKRTASKADIELTELSMLENPRINIRIGAEYLASLIKRYNGNLMRALAAYNAGPTNVKKWLAKSKGYDDPYFIDRYAFSQTRHYVKAVLNDYLFYRSYWAEKETSLSSSE